MSANILKYGSNTPNVVQNVQDLLSNVVGQAIVRPLGSPNLTGVSGYIFDIIDDEEVVMESEITDHFVEANYAVQDHIALRALRFTLRGYVGELVDVLPNALATIFGQIQGLKTLGGLLPTFNTQDAQFYAKVNKVVQYGTNVINQASNIFSLFNQAATISSRQQTAFQYFFNMWKTRQLCSVETPFAIFDSMAIESMRAIQSGITRTMSDFTVTFKQIQTVNSTVITPNVGSLFSSNFGTISNSPLRGGGRFEQIISTPVNLGTDAGTAIDSLGNSLSVNSVSKAIFQQQAQLPNLY